MAYGKEGLSPPKKFSQFAPMFIINNWCENNDANHTKFGICVQQNQSYVICYNLLFGINIKVNMCPHCLV